jgi:hypothetical protein
MPGETSSSELTTELQAGWPLRWRQLRLVSSPTLGALEEDQRREVDVDDRARPSLTFLFELRPARFGFENVFLLDEPSVLIPAFPAQVDEAFAVVELRQLTVRGGAS